MLTFKNIGKHFVNGKLKEEETDLLNIYSGVFYKYFVKKLDYKVEDYMFCLIPPHNSGTQNKSAIYYMSRWSKAIREYFNKVVIVRTKTIEKLSSGGDRSIENQLSSLSIQASVKKHKTSSSKDNTVLPTLFDFEEPTTQLIETEPSNLTRKTRKK